MAKTIAVVGNGEIAAGSAQQIDACDMVVRFNLCRSYGAGGVKSDVIALCNTGRPAKHMLSSVDWLSHPAVQKAGEIWSVRSADKFNEMRPEVLSRHPELDDFFEDFTPEIASLAARFGKSHRVIDRALHEAVDVHLAKLTGEPYVCPSSGLVALVHILKKVKGPGDEVLIAGFGHQGWALHPFEAEKRLIDAWVAKGDLKRF